MIIAIELVVVSCAEGVAQQVGSGGSALTCVPSVVSARASANVRKCVFIVQH